MKKLVIQENQGQFHLENFGAYYCGSDGRTPFTLVIESAEKQLFMEFPEVTVFDLFARFHLRDHDFMEGRFVCPDFVRVVQESGAFVVEAPCGTLYDFLKERVAAGHCVLKSARPLTFHMRGHRENVA